uniref:Uncharacterized protein n=1 Tax=Myotis myotis TaxID=51298 RepID=A0A7J7S2S9_MYOMY|nr:hypothetical protein mMyoMyo1_010092 [Myotis myotis]
MKQRWQPQSLRKCDFPSPLRYGWNWLGHSLVLNASIALPAVIWITNECLSAVHRPQLCLLSALHSSRAQPKNLPAVSSIFFLPSPVPLAPLDVLFPLPGTTSGFHLLHLVNSTQSQVRYHLLQVASPAPSLHSPPKELN